MKNLMCVFLLFMLSSFVSQGAMADTTYGNAIVSKVESVYDADTFKVDIDGWPDIIGTGISIRVNGVDAPERHGQCQSEKDEAMKVRDITLGALNTATTIELRNMRRGKYFRIRADVYIDGTSLTSILEQSGMVREYHGEHRDGWCNADGSLKL